MGYLRAHPQEELGGVLPPPTRSLGPNSTTRRGCKPMPLFATDPAALDKARYETYEQFLYNNKLVKKVTPLTNYAVQLH